MLTIKLSSYTKLDLIGWHYSKNGLYLDKYGYWLSLYLTTVVDVPPIAGKNSIKPKVWKSKAPPKIKHFLWRMLSKDLAIGELYEYPIT